MQPSMAGFENGAIVVPVQMEWHVLHSQNYQDYLTEEVSKTGSVIPADLLPLA